MMRIYGNGSVRALTLRVRWRIEGLVIIIVDEQNAAAV